jgi:hypothetical protein
MGAGVAPGIAPAPGQFGGPVAKQTNTMAIVSLVAGIASYFVCYGIGGVIAIITGIVARNDIKAHPEKWEGMGLATAGIILGAAHILLAIVLTVVYVIFVAGAIALGH